MWYFDKKLKIKIEVDVEYSRHNNKEKIIKYKSC